MQKIQPKFDEKNVVVNYPGENLDKVTMILRNNLLDSIDLSSHRVVTIVAPAGYGKSTLVDQLISGKKLCVARVDLDSFQYSVLDLIVALLEELGGLSDDFMELRSRIISMDPNRLNISAIIRNMINLINKVGLPRLVIVIEDLHELQSCPESISVLDMVIKRSDEKIKFVLTSRKKLTISLLDLASKNLIRHINENDLQFSKREISNLLAAINSIEPNDDLTTQINFITEGWPVLVTLLCGEYGKNILKLKQDELSHMMTIGYVFDFLVNEIYGVLEKSEIELLLHIWPFATVDLYEIGVFFDLNKKQVSKILNSGLPIRKVGEKEFSVHPLFKEMLKRKYFDEYDSIQNQKWEKMKELVLSSSSARSIIDFYLNIDDFKNCEKYFSLNFDQLIEFGELGFIEKILSFLERNGLDELDIGYYKCSIHNHSGHTNEAHQSLRTLLLKNKALDATSTEYYSFSYCRSALMLKILNARMSIIDNELDSLINEINESEIVRNNYYLLERSLMARLCDLVRLDNIELYSVFAQYKRLLDRRPDQNKHMQNVILSNIGAVNFFIGDFTNDIEMISALGLERFLNSSDEVLLTHIADTYFVTADYKMAQVFSKKSLQLQRISGSEAFKSLIYSTYAIIYSYQFRTLKAESVLLQSLKLALGGSHFTYYFEVALDLIDLYRRRNRSIDALRLSRDTLPKAKKLNLSFLLYWSLVCRLLPHSSSEKIIVGKNFFLKVREQLSGNYKYIHFKIDFLEAIYARQNNYSNASKLFDDVVRSAKKNLYNHFFIEESEIHLDMYLEAFSRNVEKDYIRASLIARGEDLYPKFIDRFAGSSDRQQELMVGILTCSDSRSAIDALRKIIGSSRGGQKLFIRQHLENNSKKHTEDKHIKFLTKRESEILELIAKGHSNGELAKDLFISDKTVKTHINRIFFKLGVKNRHEAIRAYKASAGVKKVVLKESSTQKAIAR